MLKVDIAHSVQFQYTGTVSEENSCKSQEPWDNEEELSSLRPTIVEMLMRASEKSVLQYLQLNIYVNTTR